ncbi:MAG: hypothetical protein Kow0065_17200 [Methylomicrobium sp.]
MLASVSSLDEALRILAFDVDIVDLKQPSDGALGALPVQEAAKIVKAVNGQRPVSATIGDLPMQPDIVVNAVVEMAGTGVDYIKIGFFPEGDWTATLDALAPLAQAGLPLIAVLFADTEPDLNGIGVFKQAGFKGVMLDTMHKHRGSLVQVLAQDAIGAFVARSAEYQLLCGLAGSLGAEDIPPLLRLQPDYLGFRGALCNRRNRTARLDNDAIEAVVRQMQSG